MKNANAWGERLNANLLAMDRDDFPVILGFGSCHEMNDADPRNPRLAGLKSVSYAGACALRRSETPRRPIGFHKPRKA